ncbi:hypothetical protein S40285_09196 [Stachybotrys chlorohalonatus IBT 40285]|uniref:Cerato-platanin n=1 Tax=Stachybotrys chlorohalonatus (strain IBT 40285) TaxID=1283841 RepID=A0A084R037_STAC4|nr:hypothetical protein S40285_09196 [Stachybotrys chlorohalonata IBT 40285]
MLSIPVHTQILAAVASAEVLYYYGSAIVTPHDMFSLSIGVPGCKINTNRVAYWPMSVDCDNICVNLSYQGRNLNLLKIDTSAGAFDISYDAWNYLGFGFSATESPRMGGGLPMNYEFVPASECADLLDDGRLPLLAANSMSYLASCLSEPSSWVSQNYKLFNIVDPVCHWGVDEECVVNLAISNQPACPSGLGLNAALDLPVINIAYGTGIATPAL